MNVSKVLNDGAWKDVAARHKVKDNGLLKALADLRRIADDEHDSALSALDQVEKLAAQLKKAREVSAAAPAAKHLAEVMAAVESDRKAVAKAKAKAEADKQVAAKRQAEAKKAAGKKPGVDEDEDDEAPSAA